MSKRGWTMNAGIIFEDEDVPTKVSQTEEMKKVSQRLKKVKRSLTKKVTLTAKAEYGILRKKLSALTGSVAW